MAAANKGKDAPKVYRNKQLETLTGYTAIAVVLLVIFIIGGGVYDIVERPPSFVQGANGYTAISPYLSEQTINESIVSMFLFACGFAGLLLVYNGTRVLYDRSKANLQIMVGIGFAMIGVVGVYVLKTLKLA